jgi:hypothetical protein
MDNKFFVYAGLAAPYIIKLLFSLAFAAAWAVGYFRQLKQAGVLLLILGAILNAIHAIVAGCLAIYITANNSSLPHQTVLSYYASLGLFNTFAPIFVYLVELTGIILIVFRKRAEDHGAETRFRP